MKKLICVTLILVLVFGNMYAAVSLDNNQESKAGDGNGQTFSDVPPSHWAFEFVSEMDARGVISGYLGGEFRPDNNVTRGEFAKMITLAAGLLAGDVKTGYQDVSLSDWYAPYIAAAEPYLAGYESSEGMVYRPNENAKREDIAVALAKQKGYETGGYDESALKSMFYDYQAISADAGKYVAAAVSNGLISGYEDGTFKGQAGITRAEAATLLWRAYIRGNENSSTASPEESTPTALPVLTAEPTPVVPDVAAGYEWSVNTLAGDISQVNEIIAIENGVAIVENNVVKTVSYDGKVETVFELWTLPWQGRPEDGEVIAFTSHIISIGFNPYTKELYAWIDQAANYNEEAPSLDVVYNITKKTVFYSNRSAYLVSAGFNMVYQPYIRKHYTPNKAGKIYGFSSDGGIFLGKAVITPSKTISIANWPAEYYFVHNDSLFAIDNEYMLAICETDTGKWVEIETDRIKDVASTPVYLSAGNGKAYFYIKEKDEIVALDVSGKKQSVMKTDKVVVNDSKMFSGADVADNSAVVDMDENIVYWDPDAKCLRKISRKPLN